MHILAEAWPTVSPCTPCYVGAHVWTLECSGKTQMVHHCCHAAQHHLTIVQDLYELLVDDRLWKWWPCLVTLRLQSSTLEQSLAFVDNVEAFLENASSTFQQLQFAVTSEEYVYSYIRDRKGWMCRVQCIA